MILTKVHVIYWKYFDGSSGGIVKAYVKPEAAQSDLKMLQENAESQRGFVLVEVELDTRGTEPPMEKIENATKVVEMRSEYLPWEELTLDAKSRAILLPVVTKDGYGEIKFTASGAYTEDGVEIWTPEREAMKIPVMLDHDIDKIVGFVRVQDGKLLVDFLPEEKITKEQAFEIFGGAALGIIAWTTEKDNCYIHRARIIEFSLTTPEALPEIPLPRPGYSS